MLIKLRLLLLTCFAIWAMSATAVAQPWAQLGADIDGEAAGDRSGTSVSLSADGSIVAIGAYENDGNGGNAGHGRVYENLAGTWTQQGADIDGEAAADFSGYSVSLSADGSIVAIGARYNAGNGTRSGHVRVYYHPLDFGDAPDPAYPTLLASDGARHALDGVTFLGPAIDDESDGQPSANLDGDGTDEDGIASQLHYSSVKPHRLK